MKPVIHPHFDRICQLAFLALALFGLTHCGSKAPSSASKFHYTGTVTKTAGARLHEVVGLQSSAKTVDYVMAVNPQLANPDRVLVPVDAEGHFNAEVQTNRPYYLVLLDSHQVGAEMIVAIIQSNGLQAFATTKTEGSADLGTVTADPTTQAATVSADYATLLAAIGISSDSADYLKTVQSIGLRYANPDVDGNGVIDILENKTFNMDFHIRSNMMDGSSANQLTVSDMTDKFFDISGSHAARLLFNLASAYAIYPTSFDSTSYPGNGGVDLTLNAGGAFAATESDGSTPSSPTSFSGGAATTGFVSFGADYDLTNGAEQLPGSRDGSAATYRYHLGAVGKDLTFTNVKTRTKEDLASTGTVVPFLKFNTVGGVITSVSYQFMRPSGGSWVEATDEQVNIVVNDNGAYAGFYYHTKSSRFSCQLPRQASGMVSLSGCALENVSAAQIAALTPADVCGMAVSYDDKLGLRIFAGSAQPNAGVTPCP